MFKVLIIDDEAIIRKGLRNIINWKQFDCEVCGEASNGIEGLEMIKSMRPNIIITDIRMPGMDGLSMINEVKDIVPDCKVVILTGHRDFDYIHEAIKLGAFDFLLKPSKIEELTSVLQRAVKELRFSNDKEEEIERLRKLFEQNIPVLREKLLYDIIHEINCDENEIHTKMVLLGIHIGKFYFAVVETDTEELQHHEEKGCSQEIGGHNDKHLYQFGILNTFEETFADTFEVKGISLNDRWVGFIIQGAKDELNCLEIIHKKCAYMQDIIKSCFGFTVTVGISSEGQGEQQLSSKFTECREALEHKFYMGSNSIIFHHDLSTFFKYDNYSQLEVYRKSLLDSIKAGNEKTVQLRLDEIKVYMDALEKLNLEYMKNYFWNTLSSINCIRLSIHHEEQEKGGGSQDLSSLYKMINDCDGVKELHEILQKVSMDVTQKVNSFNHKSIKLVLRKAVEYLQEHYHEQVTLNEVAEKVFVSTCYISRMFKKELGKNFVDYLNEIRVAKAKELLVDLKYKTYEVADQVGINDAHYFSRLFKKYTGLTPTEFRDQK